MTYRIEQIEDYFIYIITEDGIDTHYQDFRPLISGFNRMSYEEAIQEAELHLERLLNPIVISEIDSLTQSGTQSL
jgi:hypothetical protein